MATWRWTTHGLVVHCQAFEAAVSSKALVAIGKTAITQAATNMWTWWKGDMVHQITDDSPEGRNGSHDRSAASFCRFAALCHSISRRRGLPPLVFEDDRQSNSNGSQPARVRSQRNSTSHEAGTFWTKGKQPNAGYFAVTIK
jgi:hypothetical protein